MLFNKDIPPPVAHDAIYVYDPFGESSDGQPWPQAFMEPTPQAASGGVTARSAGVVVVFAEWPP